MLQIILISTNYDIYTVLHDSINFKQYEKPQKEVPVNSEVLKALMEQESLHNGVAGMSALQEDRQCNCFLKFYLIQGVPFDFLVWNTLYLFLQCVIPPPLNYINYFL